MAEETNKETIAGGQAEMDETMEAGQHCDASDGAKEPREEGKPEKNVRPEEAGAQKNADPEETDPEKNVRSEEAEPEEGKPEEETEPEDAPESDVVDGIFTKAEETGKKSFFKKKKDKRDEKIEELTDQVKRQMAEFDNFRKRTEKEKSQMFDFGAKNVIEKILPVIDNFERGLAQAENKDDPFVDGMEKIYKSMLQELEAIGVKPIEAEGKEFDPNFHNAVMHCEDDSVGENIVVQELQKGYMYHDSVVRHSMVKVAN